MTENEMERDKKQYLEWLHGKGSERARREMKPKKESKFLTVVLWTVLLAVAWWAIRK
jgi:hypothetical protein